MARKRYDDKFRASAIAMLEAAGWPDEKGALTRVAKHLGMPLATLSRWAKEKNNPPPTEVVTEKKGDLTALIDTEIRAIFGDMPSARANAPYNHLAIAFGILADKLQLLSGGPTQRTEVSDTSNARELITSRISEYSARNGENVDTGESDG